MRSLQILAIFGLTVVLVGLAAPLLGSAGNTQFQPIVQADGHGRWSDVIIVSGTDNPRFRTASITNTTLFFTQTLLFDGSFEITLGGQLIEQDRDGSVRFIVEPDSQGFPEAITILHGNPTAFLEMHVGWNMISSPVGPAPLSALQGNCSVTSGPWRWDGTQYQKASVIESGKGYWVRVAHSCTMQASGSNVTQNLTLVSGWNMISTSTSWNQMNTGGCSLLSGPWWYDGTQYQQIPLDMPMDNFKGYWVMVGGSCSVTSQALQNAWSDSRVPPGPPTASAAGFFAGFLKLMGILPRAVVPQPSIGSLSVQEIRVAVGKSGRITLQITRTGIMSSELRLYGLSGQLIARAEGAGSQLRFTVLSHTGQALANGIYLYVVTVRGVTGETLSSGVKWLLVLR